MIIDPDFPDHWKTRMLVGALNNDETAPVYLLRLWGHCQNRRQSEGAPIGLFGVVSRSSRRLIHVPECLMEGATMLTCSEFAKAIVSNME